jgi:hypothetical protein
MITTTEASDEDGGQIHLWSDLTMDETKRVAIATGDMVVGMVLIAVRIPEARTAGRFYRKLGIDVPDPLYAKQFLFIGVLLVLFGFRVSPKAPVMLTPPRASRAFSRAS